MSYYNPERIIIDIEIPSYILIKQPSDNDLITDYILKDLERDLLFFKHKQHNEFLGYIFKLVEDLNNLNFAYEIHWQELKHTNIYLDIFKIDPRIGSICDPKVIYNSYINNIVNILRYYNLYNGSRLDYVFEMILRNSNNIYTVTLIRRDIFVKELQFMEKDF